MAVAASPQRPTPAFSQGIRPGPISNDELLPDGYLQQQALHAESAGAAAAGDELPLRPGLTEHVDFVIVTEAAWARLHGWYSGGPAIARRMVSQPGDGDQPWLRVLLYPLSIEVVYREPGGGGTERCRTVLMDPSRPISELKAQACCLLDVPEAEVELVEYTGRSRGPSLEALPKAGLGAAAPPPQQRADGTGGSDVGDNNAGGAVADPASAALARSLQDALVMDRSVLLLQRKVRLVLALWCVLCVWL